jgi:hypothetical protein
MFCQTFDIVIVFRARFDSLSEPCHAVDDVVGHVHVCHQCPLQSNCIVFFHFAMSRGWLLDRLNGCGSSLDFEGEGLLDENVQALCDAFKCSPNTPVLQSLSLADNQLTAAGVAALAQALPHVSHLTALDLSGNAGIIGSEQAEIACHALAKACKAHPALRIFRLQHMNLSAPVALALAQAMTRHPTLECLDLRGNSMLGATSHKLILQYCPVACLDVTAKAAGGIKMPRLGDATTTADEPQILSIVQVLAIHGDEIAALLDVHTLGQLAQCCKTTAHHMKMQAMVRYVACTCYVVTAATRLHVALCVCVCVCMCVCVCGSS